MMLSATVMEFSFTSQNTYSLPPLRNFVSSRNIESNRNPNTRNITMALTNTAEKCVRAKKVIYRWSYFSECSTSSKSVSETNISIDDTVARISSASTLP